MDEYIKANDGRNFSLRSILLFQDLNGNSKEACRNISNKRITFDLRK
jgi:hypothetical protein